MSLNMSKQILCLRLANRIRPLMMQVRAVNRDSGLAIRELHISLDGGTMLPILDAECQRESSLFGLTSVVDSDHGWKTSVGFCLMAVAILLQDSFPLLLA